MEELVEESWQGPMADWLATLWFRYSNGFRPRMEGVLTVLYRVCTCADTWMHAHIMYPNTVQPLSGYHGEIHVLAVRVATGSKMAVSLYTHAA